jgi:hypothetical protein
MQQSPFPQMQPGEQLSPVQFSGQIADGTGVFGFIPWPCGGPAGIPGPDAQDPFPVHVGERNEFRPVPGNTRQPVQEPERDSGKAV